MAYLFVQHTVHDFEIWKHVYDSMNASKRVQGWLGGRILRGTDNPNQVIVLDEYATLEQAKAWAQNPELHVAMGHAGVNSKPELVFLESI